MDTVLFVFSIVGSILGILGFLIGGGILVNIWKSGRTWGEYVSRLNRTESSVDSLEKLIRAAEEGSKAFMTVEEITRRIGAIHKRIDELNTISEERSVNIHNRLNTVNEVINDTNQKIIAHESGFTAIMRDVETLLSDVRELLTDNIRNNQSLEHVRELLNKLDQQTITNRDTCTKLASDYNHISQELGIVRSTMMRQQ